MSDVPFQSAVEQSCALAAGEISSRELVELCLERIAIHNTVLNAVVTLDAERARREAKAADAARAAGRDLGPLHGVPITVKDSFETAGMRTVAVKLNSADFQRGGFTEEESRSVVAALAKEGLDLIEVSGGSYESPAMMGSATASTRAREAYFLEYARTVRGLVGDVPLAVTGGFRSRGGMEEAVAAGECDVVGMGRPTATTPDAADVILAGRAEAVVAHQLRAGMRRVLGRVADIKALDGVLDLSWHTDQLHRLGAGLEPDLRRGRLATTVSMVRRNGRTSFRRKRGA